MKRKLLQIYLLWRMVREGKRKAQKRWRRKYFGQYDIISQLSNSERVILADKYGVAWMIPTMDLGFSIGERKIRTDFPSEKVSEYPIERYDPKYDSSLMYFESMRDINQYHRKIFWKLLKKII